MAAAADAWTSVAGADRVGSIPVRRSRAGVVTVACADAGLAQKLAFRADALADALGAALGEPVRGLRFTIADHAIPPPSGPAVRVPVTPGPAARSAARGLVAGAGDPELRAALERAAAASIQRSWDTK
ncbi:MAG: DUF721 domain-containing protein [Thermoleophilia bacterium]|nr:DUF721 domain-containing protein [Thermoleophilia bacterium]